MSSSCVQKKNRDCLFLVDNIEPKPFSLVWPQAKAKNQVPCFMLTVKPYPLPELFPVLNRYE